MQDINQQLYERKDVSVSNSNNIISVTANTTTSSFTILCQFTMTSNSTVFNVRVLIEP